jgi:uncharacterized repeat protein (TIGR02543 family)
LFTWGDNSYGKIGDGTTATRSLPTDITSKFNLMTDETIVDISLGGSHSSIVTSNCRIFTWGYNQLGNLGDGTTYTKSLPTDITDKFNLDPDETIVNVSLGLHHSSALSSKGQVYIWGDNEYGQLGDTTTINKLSPENLPIIYCSTVQTYFYSLPITEYCPVREGYNFSGWYTDANLTTPYTYGNMPSKDLCLFGKWY